MKIYAPSWTCTLYLAKSRCAPGGGTYFSNAPPIHLHLELLAYTARSFQAIDVPPICDRPMPFTPTYAPLPPRARASAGISKTEGLHVVTFIFAHGSGDDISMSSVGKGVARLDFSSSDFHGKPDRGHLAKIPSPVGPTCSSSNRVGILYVYPIIASCRTVSEFPGPRASIPESSAAAHADVPDVFDESQSAEHWSLYWLISSIITFLLEKPVDAVISWVPLYRWMKLALFLWLALPRFQGAARLYYVLLQPLLITYEPEISNARDSVWKMTKKSSHSAAVAVLSFLTTTVTASEVTTRRNREGMAGLADTGGLEAARLLALQAARSALANFWASADVNGAGGPLRAHAARVEAANTGAGGLRRRKEGRKRRSPTSRMAYEGGSRCKKGGGDDKK